MHYLGPNRITNPQTSHFIISLKVKLSFCLVEMQRIHPNELSLPEMFTAFLDPQAGVMGHSRAAHFRCLQPDCRKGMKVRHSLQAERKIQSMKNINLGDIRESINH